MDRFGIRPVVLAALVLMIVGSTLTATLSAPWQLVVGWGLLVGLGSGAMALTFGAVVTERWFRTRRGLVSGVLTSSSMVGGMVLMPLLAWIMHHHGWRAGIVAVGGASLVLLPLAALVLRDHPASIGIRPHGATEFVPAPARSGRSLRRAFAILRRALVRRSFWLLALTFGVCGASTNGIMMTHFVPAAAESGMAPVAATSVLATMGVFNVVGAAGSGWLTDRARPELLLVVHYLARAATLLVLPPLLGPHIGTPIVAFAVVYGLLDLATVPPTIALCRTHFGPLDGPIVFGWISGVHAIGAAAAAYLGNVGRDAVESYDPVWYGAGVLCIVAAGLATRLSGRTERDDGRRAPSCAEV